MDTISHGGQDGTVNIVELSRALIEAALNEIMDAQADDMCEDTGTVRNGYRDRSLTTSVGAISLRIPKLRAGTYFPEQIVDRYSRTDKAVVAAVREMYVNGVSTRKVERVAARLGVDKMSSQQVSRMCASIDAEVSGLVNRDLSAVKCPYLWLDATYVKCRRGGHVASTAVVTAIACGTDGVRRFAGIGAVDAESYESWSGFLLDLRKRGLSGVACVTSDAHEGLKRAISEVFTGAAWQRCIVHLERNVSSVLKSKRHRSMACKAMQAVFREEDPTAVRAAYHAAIDAIGEMSAAAAGILEEAEPDALAYLDFPAEHRKRLRTNNVQERANREIKRRSKAVQVFPSAESMIRLVGAVCCEMDEDWSSRKYIAGDAMERFYEEDVAAAREASAEAARSARPTAEQEARGAKIVELAMDTAA